jgi:hypothetical protein
MIKKILITAALLSAMSAVTAADKITINSIEDLKKCKEQYSWDTSVCFDAYQKFVNKNPGQALEAAKAGRTVFADWVVLPIFDKIYARSKDSAICKDRDFQLSLVSALGQPPRNEVYKVAEKFLKNECAPYLVEIAMKELDSSAGASEIKNFCPLLKANGKNHPACELKPEAVRSESEVLPVIEKSKIKLGRVKAYRGPEGAMVFIAHIKEGNDAYLVKFHGIKGPWDNKTILHRARQLKDGSIDYWTEHNGKTWNSIIVRDCIDGYCQVTMFAPELGNPNGLAISYDKKKSERATPPDLMDTFSGA